MNFTRHFILLFILIISRSLAYAQDEISVPLAGVIPLNIISSASFLNIYYDDTTNGYFLVQASKAKLDSFFLKSIKDSIEKVINHVIVLDSLYQSATDRNIYRTTYQSAIDADGGGSFKYLIAFSITSYTYPKTGQPSSQLWFSTNVLVQISLGLLNENTNKQLQYVVKENFNQTNFAGFQKVSGGGWVGTIWSGHWEAPVFVPKYSSKTIDHTSTNTLKAPPEYEEIFEYYLRKTKRVASFFDVPQQTLKIYLVL